MQIDLLTLAECIGACGVIGGLIFAVFSFIENNKKQSQDIDKIKSEQTLQMYAIRACLDGLKQQGCNGNVTEAINRIDKHLNMVAHEQKEN